MGIGHPSVESPAWRRVGIDLRALPATPGAIDITTCGSEAATPLTTNFAALTTVNGALTLTSLDNLQTMAGFSALTTVKGELQRGRRAPEEAQKNGANLLLAITYDNATTVHVGVSEKQLS